LLALAALGCQRSVPPAEIPARLAAIGRPDLVLIVVDTLRADWTTPYGFAKPTTPELQRWAERGAVFESARSQSSWTKISMASLMTSLWPRSLAIREPTDGIAEGAVTLAELLRDAGYRTYAVQTNGWLHQSFGFHQGFEHFVFPSGAGARLPHASIWPHADRVVEEASRLIDAHPTGAPMFLYLHFMDVHEYAAPPEFRTFGTDNSGNYQAGIRWVDDAIERVREKLGRAGRLERAVLVLASDHGEAFGENGRVGHARNVLSAVLRVPLVVRFPFPIEPVRVATQVRNIDVAPTLLDLANVPVPDGFEGRSLLPLVTGAAPEREDREAFAALGEPLYRDAVVQESVTDGEWTYARNLGPEERKGEEFLFDRSLDPGENVNLIARETQQAARWRAALDRHDASGAHPEALATDVRIDPGIAQRLRAMGYLQ
jgi:arylsulfatase A-like enzyme